METKPIYQPRRRLFPVPILNIYSGPGRDIPGVTAALVSSPELEKTKREYETAFIEKCRHILSPFSGGVISSAGLWAMPGAAESLSYAAATGGITPAQA